MTRRQCWQQVLGVVVLGSAVLLATGGRLWAAADTWQNGVSGDFSDGTKWTDGTPPGAGDTATFNVAGTYTVTFLDGVTNQAVTVSQGDVTYTSSGGPWTYTLSGGGLLDAFVNGGTLTLGTSGHALNLTVAGGLRVVTGGTLNVKYGSAVTADTLRVGTIAGAAGTVVVDGSGSTLALTGAMHYLGGTATGNLTFQNNAQGSFAGRLTLDYGTGNLTVQSGADLTLGNLTMGMLGEAGQSGTATVTGSGSTVAQTGASTLIVGAAANSPGTLNVNSSGVFTTGTGLMTINKTGTVSIAGGTLNANGNIAISGGALTQTTGTFTWAAGKTMTITGGGRFTSVDTYTLPDGASVGISGAGSRWESIGASLNLRNGSHVNVNAGGLLSAAGFIDIATGGNGTLVVDGDGATARALGGSASYWGGSGATATVTFRNNAAGVFGGGLQLVSDAAAGTAANVTVESGADLTAGFLSIGTAGGSTAGTLTLTGAGSTVTLSGTGPLTVGHSVSGTGTLIINSSGVFTTGTGLMTINKTGTVSINGGTLWANGDIAIAGGTLNYFGGSLDWDAGKTMTITGGGCFHCAGGYWFPEGASVGISGAGSRFDSGDTFLLWGGSHVNVNAGGLLSAADSIDIGIAGNGTLVVDGDGATAQVLAGSASYWGGLGATATVTFRNNAAGVFGGGLALVSDDTAGSAANVTVESGADLSVGDLWIDTAGGATTATLTVTGAGSTVTQPGTSLLTIGHSVSGTGTLNINSSGVFTTGTGLMTINKTGTVNVAGGTLNANGDIAISGGALTQTTGTFTWAAGKTMTLTGGGRFTSAPGYTLPDGASVGISGAGSRFEITGGSFGLANGSHVNVNAGGLLSASVYMDIGILGNGTLVVDGDGATARALAGSASHWGGSGATATVTFRNNAAGVFGGGLALVSDSTAGSAANVTVESGADLSVGDLWIDTAGGATTATVTVTGAGSTVTQPGASLLTVGHSSTGTGTLNINSSGVFTTGTGLMTIDKTGTVNVAGGTLNANGDIAISGGTLNYTSGTFAWAAAKTMTVTGGGRFSSAPGYVLPDGASVGISGAGSRFESTSGFFLLLSGSHVNVNAGGLLSAAGWMFIGTIGNGTLVVDGDGATAQALAGAGSASLWGASGGTATVTFRNNAAGVFGGGLQLVSGAAAGSAANVTVESGADLSVGDLWIETGGGSTTGSLTVTGAGSTVTQPGASLLTVGHSSTGTGTVNINSSGVFTTGTGLMTINKTGTVNIAGGTLNANGDIAIAGGALTQTTGTFTWAAGKMMSITGGGRFTSVDSYTLPDGASVGISGAGSRLESTGGSLVLAGGSHVNVNAGGLLSAAAFIDIAIAGNGTLVVDGDGATARVLGGNYSLWGGSGGTATATFRNNAAGVFGGGLCLVFGSMAGTTANVTVESGADLSVGNLEVNVIGGSTTGSLTVTGAGSTVTQPGACVLDVGHSSTGTGTLNINSSGVFTTGTGRMTINKTGTVNVAGGTLNANGDISISGGTLNCTSGTFAWAAGRTMTLTGGGRFGSAASYSLPDGASVGISGAGSRFESTGGSLNLQNGNHVNVNAGGLLSAAGFIDIAFGNNGTLVVDGDGATAQALSGSGSLWGRSGATATVAFRNNAAGVFGGGLALVSDSMAGGAANVAIESGADLTVGQALRVCDVGTPGGDGTVTVIGAGSTLTLTGAGQLTLGHASLGAATLNVNDGGQFQAGTGGTVLNPTGLINIIGGIANLGPLTQNGGHINFSAFAGTLSYDGDLTVGDGGLMDSWLELGASKRLILTGTTTISGWGMLILDGGYLSTGALECYGLFQFDRGALILTDSDLTVGTGGTPFGPTLALGDGKVINVAHTVAIDPGALVSLEGGALWAGTINNHGQIHLDDVASQLGGGTLNNYDLLTGDGRVTASLWNASSGVVRVGAGDALRFEGGGNLNDGQVSLLGGTVEFTQGLTNGASGVITGRGGLLTGGPGLTNYGSLAFSAGFTDVYGDVVNATGGKIYVSGGAVATFWDDVTHSGSTFRVSQACAAVFFGAYGGTGITGPGTVYFEGDLKPGSSPAAVSFGGDVVFGSAANLEIEIGGTTPGTQYDAVSVAGEATLDGTCDVTMIWGFRPAHNDAFQVMTWGTRSGTFDAINGLDLGSRLTLAPTYETGALVLTAVQGGSGQWRYDTSGNASVPGNWTGGLPNGVGDVAAFGPAILIDRTVTLDQPRTWGGMDFDDNDAYNVAGPSLLTLQAVAGDAAVNVTGVNGNGNHRVTAPVKLSSPLAINHASTGTLSFEGALDNSLGMVMTKNGAGAVVISGQQTHGLGAALDVTAGSVDLASDAGFGGRNLSVAASNAAALAFSASQHLEALTLNDTSTAVLGDTRVLVTKALAFEGGASPTATLDLTTGNAVVDYPGGGTSPMAEVLAWVKSGLSGGPTGYWDGPGITSSAAHDATLTAVAVIDNNGLDSLKDDLEGEPVDHDAILLKYTYLGDNDLSGRVDWENDFLAFQNGVLFGIKNDNNWLYGDYNYDGKVDWENDFLAFQNGMLFQGGPLSGGGQASDLRGVPEPATLTLLLLGAAAALVRRRRRVRD